jgi:hypothetical protein
MRKLMFVVALSILGAGQLKADATCVAGSVTSYVATTSCNYGGLDFSNFSSALFASPGLSGFSTDNIIVTPTADSNGVGFTIAPAAPADWATNQIGQQLDLDFAFVASCMSGSPCMTDIYESIAGSATSSAFGTQYDGRDVLTETYCLNSTTPPAGSCAPGNGGVQITTLTPTGGSPVISNPTFSPVTSIVMDKDIGAYSYNSSAAITSVIDEFSLVSTPEPSALLMLGSGLLGLAIVSFRKRSVA